MSSQQQVHSIISSLTSVETFEKIDGFLPEMIRFLECESNSPEFSKVLEILLKDGIKHFDLETVQEIFLQSVLSSTKKIFFKRLTSIQLSLTGESSGGREDKEISLKEDLKAMTDVMDGYSYLLAELISSSCSVHASRLDSVPTVIITVTSEAFVHCRSSEGLYGSYFSKCSAMLSNLFKRSFQVQSLLLKSLDENFLFPCDSSHPETTRLLLLVLDKSMEMGEIACDVDAGCAAIVEQWKGFVKLTAKHRDTLHHRLDVTTLFRILNASLRRILDNFHSSSMQGEEDGGASSVCVRHLKSANFLMKVIVKLCEVFAASLSDDCVTLLFHLIIKIYGMDQRMLSVGSDMGQMFKSYITLGTSTLLSHLLSRPPALIHELRRAESWTNDPDEMETRSAALLVMLVSLSGKLLKAGEEVRRPWLDKNFIEIVLHIFSACSLNSRKPIVVEERESYGMLVSTTALLVSTVTDIVAFNDIEAIIFRCFLQLPLDTGLFIQDLLCLLARLTKESVVVAWVDWLERVEKRIHRHSIVGCQVMSLHKRLLTLLSPKSRRDRFEPHLKLIVDSITPRSSLPSFHKLVGWLEQRAAHSTMPSELDFSTMEQSTVICLWECLVESRPSEHAHRQWWNRIFVLLAIATSSIVDDWSRFEQIVNVMDVALSVDGGDLLSVSMIAVLASASRHCDHRISDDRPCPSKLSRILVDFIFSSCSLPVKIFSLEVIRLFSRVDCVRDALDRTLRRHPSSALPVISSYLAGRVLTLSDTDTFIPPNCSSSASPPDSLLLDGLLAVRRVETLLQSRRQTLTVRQKSLLVDLISHCRGLQQYL